ARAHDPLSVEPLFARAVVEQAAADRAAAGRTLEAAVALQPRNPETWRRLAEYELTVLRRPRVALRAIRSAVYLNPRAGDVAALYLRASRGG
nr:hypothetical protein [Solirubrobacterales bacterium]